MVSGVERLVIRYSHNEPHTHKDGDPAGLKTLLIFESGPPAYSGWFIVVLPPDPQCSWFGCSLLCRLFVVCSSLWQRDKSASLLASDFALMVSYSRCLLVCADRFSGG